MSIGLDFFVEIKNKDTGKWEEFTNIEHDLFSYGCREFWTPWKRDSHVPTAPWGERGWPKDSDWLNALSDDSRAGTWFEETNREARDYDGNFYHSYVTLKELICFNYDEFFIPTDQDGNIVQQPWYPFDKQKYRDHLGIHYFNGIVKLIAATYELNNDWESVRIIYNLS